MQWLLEASGISSAIIRSSLENFKKAVHFALATMQTWTSSNPVPPDEAISKYHEHLYKQLDVKSEEHTDAACLRKEKPRKSWPSVQNIQLNTETTTKELLKDLEASGTNVLYVHPSWHGLKRCRKQEEAPPLRLALKKSLVEEFSLVRRNKKWTFWPWWSGLARRYGGKRVRCEAASCCVALKGTDAQNRWYHEGGGKSREKKRSSNTSKHQLDL